MIISLIVAMDRNRGIGKDNVTPWRISSDLRRFKKLTMGHYIVMGRKTYESISRPLPGRKMIILTRSKDYKVDGSIVLHSVEDAIRLAEEHGENEMFVIGGGEIYTQSLIYVDRIYRTLVDAVVDTDVFFPELQEKEWEIVFSKYIFNEDTDQFPYTYQILERKSKSGINPKLT